MYSQTRICKLSTRTRESWPKSHIMWWSSSEIGHLNTTYDTGVQYANGLRDGAVVLASVLPREPPTAVITYRLAIIVTDGPADTPLRGLRLKLIHRVAAMKRPANPPVNFNSTTL